MILDQKELILYDVSAIISVGSKSKRQCKWNYNGIPTGGLYTLINYIVQDTKKNANIIFCFDSPRSKSLRKIFYPEYKANRNKNSIDIDFDSLEYIDLENFDELKKEFDLRGITKSEIENFSVRESTNLQLNLAMKMIKDLNLPFVYQLGYEADDLIYSLCYTYGAYKNIKIRADDGDLVDAKIFGENISFLPMTSKSINTTELGVLEEKIFKGCSSDNIIGLGSDSKYKILKKALNRGIINPFQFKNLKDNELILQPLIDIGYTNEEAYEISRTFYAVYPFIFNIPESIFESFSQELDIDKFINYLSAFGLKRSLKSLGSEIVDNQEVRDYINEVKSKISPILKYYLSE